jgi:hypothetical protein
VKVGHSCRRKGSGRPGRGEFTPVDSGPTCGRPVRARSVRLTQGPPAMRPFCDGWSGQRCHRRLRHRHSSARDKQRRDRDCPCRCMRCFGCGTPLDRFTRFFQPDWIKAVYPPGSDWDAVAADIPAFVPGLRGQKDCSSEQNYQQARARAKLQTDRDLWIPLRTAFRWVFGRACKEILCRSRHLQDVFIARGPIPPCRHRAAAHLAGRA